MKCEVAMNELKRARTRERGQTLIIAMIVLGLLLILGFVFLGIVDRNIRGGATARTRSQSDDLAEAGIRYAQQELLDSPAGADWRGTPTTLTPVGTTGASVNFTRDPDAYYLRPGSGVDLPNHPKQNDLGGPDGLGPYIRVNTDQGRSLIRVRYGPSDVNIFSASPVGPIRSPGAVRNYLIVESVGRQGIVNTSDPTTLANGNGIQFQGYASTSDLQTALNALKTFDAQNPNSRHLEAFATTGLIDNARFITNKFQVNRPADIGPSNPYVNTGTGTVEQLPGVGIDYSNSAGVAPTDIGSMFAYQLGSGESIAAPSNNAVPQGFGSFRANSDVTFHGNSIIFLNQTFGDGIRIDGNILGDDNAKLELNVSSYSPASNSWTTAPSNILTPQLFDSRSPAFLTQGGLLVDGVAGTDQNGNSRGVGRLEPPSILRVDPQSKTNRYIALTRGTNSQLSTGGPDGHGNGVYVGNTSDIQAPADEAGRVGSGSSESLLDDWSNPGNPSPTTGWRGPFYVPVGAFVQLLPDGFTIQLDHGSWPDQSTNIRRYRVGRVGSDLFIMDSEEDPADINSASGLPYSIKGVPFNGVLYFEGNVRIRGTIPTDVQLTVVSGATIYIEGSIKKGAIGNDVTDSYASADPLFANYNSPLTRLSKSAVMLMAKDYVAVNTSQFFGLQAGQSVQEVNDQQNATGYNALDMSSTPGASQGELNFQHELLTDPTTGTSTNPSTYVPYAMGYKDAVNNTPVNTMLMLTHTMADGTGAASFIGMNVNLGITNNQANTVFSFPGTTSTQSDNTASDYLASGTTSVSMYGLGKQPWQRYDKFESRGFNLIYPAQSTYDSTTQLITNNNPNTDPFAVYSLAAPGSNDFTLRSTSIVGVASNDYLLARAALAPDDIVIEASIYAEEGSFVVIPGPWFNPNPNDTRFNYLGRVSALTTGGMTATQAQDQANSERQEAYGNSPEVPFYGEPLDDRLQIIGSVAENMPPPLSYQNLEVQKWGWIPVSIGSSQGNIPDTHVPIGTTVTAASVVPNTILSYDPALATGRAAGFSSTNATGDLIRTDDYGRALLPMPRLPVSPNLVYFGDVQ